MKKKLVLAALLSGAVVVFGDGFSLTNELVVLSLDARGWSTQLVERATGRVLAAGAVPFAAIDNMFFAVAAFTATATAVVFIASCALRDVSVYDPYWSVAPPVMLAAAVIKYRLYNANSFVLLAVISVWAVRLTANWYVTYKGIGHEDWRYAQYRASCPPLIFHLISFFGLHFVPTIVVYAALVSGLLAIQAPAFSPLSLLGVLVMLP